MDKTLKPRSYTEQIQDSLFSWKISRHLYHVMKECQVANFHMQTFDPYAYAWTMQVSLCSWITLWNLYIILCFRILHFILVAMDRCVLTSLTKLTCNNFPLWGTSPQLISLLWGTFPQFCIMRPRNKYLSKLSLFSPSGEMLNLSILFTPCMKTIFNIWPRYIYVTVYTFHRKVTC
jgi:hypothetical protein